MTPAAGPTSAASPVGHRAEDTTGTLTWALTQEQARAVDRNTERARQTRSDILAAAQRVFERLGYLDARVADIAAECGRSHGTVYTYFSSKDDVFRAVMELTLEDVYTSGFADRGDHRLTQRETIDQVNRNFIAVYRANAAMLGLFEQVATYDLSFRQVRLAVRHRAVARVERNLRRLQAGGLCSTDLHPATTASALVTMVNAQVYYWLVLGEEHEEELLVQTLNALWARAIGLVADA